MRCAVTPPTGEQDRGVSSTHAPKLGREVVQLVGDDVNRRTLALNAAVHLDHAGREDEPPLLLEQLGPHDEVGHPGLVLDGDEHDALRGAGLLTHQDQARQPAAPAVSDRLGCGAGHHSLALQLLAEKRERMATQRQAGVAVVLDHLSPFRHGPQRHGRLYHLRREHAVARVGRREQAGARCRATA